MRCVRLCRLLSVATLKLFFLSLCGRFIRTSAFVLSNNLLILEDLLPENVNDMWAPNGVPCHEIEWLKTLRGPVVQSPDSRLNILDKYPYSESPKP